MTDHLHPLVTIIMPVYNGGQFIRSSINSVIHQSHLNWELLIINDGSTDSSKATIQSFNDSRIFYFEQPNRGVSAARNLGLRHMKGDYFCFLDSDDVFPADSIEARLKVFNEFESVQFVDGVVEVYDHLLTQLVRVRKASVKGDPFWHLLRMNPAIFFGPTWMIKRDMEVTYSFNEDMKYLEDLNFYFQISAQGGFSSTKEVILKYRTHNHSAMRNLDGIAVGYTQLVNSVLKKFPTVLTVIDKWILKLRVRKIMALSFFGEKQWLKGFKYFIHGKL